MIRVSVGPPLVEQILLAREAKRPVLLEGDTGLGKSEIIKEVAERLDIIPKTIDLTLLEPSPGTSAVSGGRIENRADWRGDCVYVVPVGDTSTGRGDFK